MLEVQQHYLGLQVEVCVKALDCVHSMEVGLPRIDLRSCLNALTNILFFSLIF